MARIAGKFAWVTRFYHEEVANSSECTMWMMISEAPPTAQSIFDHMKVHCDIVHIAEFRRLIHIVHEDKILSNGDNFYMYGNVSGSFEALDKDNLEEDHDLSDLYMHSKYYFESEPAYLV